VGAEIRFIFLIDYKVLTMHHKGSYWLVINTPQSIERQLNGTLHLVSQIVNEKVISSKVSEFFLTKSNSLMKM